MVDLESNGKSRKKKASSTSSSAKTSVKKKTSADTGTTTKAIRVGTGSSMTRSRADSAPATTLRADASTSRDIRGQAETGLHRNGHRDAIAAAPAAEKIESAHNHSRGTYTEEERRRLIAEAAYRRAEKRGFRAGSPHNDWLEAEAEVDAWLLRSEAQH